MGGMPPPQQHIRAGQPLLRQTVLQLIQSRRHNLQILLYAQSVRQRPMNSLGIYAPHLFACLLVPVFVPYGNFNSLRHSLSPLIRINLAHAIISMGV
ncbi:hypothetical protein D3C75_1043640 [compost metagenome]